MCFLHVKSESCTLSGRFGLDVSDYDPPRLTSKTWRQLIHKVWEVDPLVCARCGAEMKVSALIDDPAVIRRSHTLNIQSFTQYSLPSAPCPMLSGLCSLPHAPCLLPYISPFRIPHSAFNSHCPIPSAQSLIPSTQYPLFIPVTVSPLVAEKPS